MSRGITPYTFQQGTTHHGYAFNTNPALGAAYYSGEHVLLPILNNIHYYSAQILNGVSYGMSKLFSVFQADYTEPVKRATKEAVSTAWVARSSGLMVKASINVIEVDSKKVDTLALNSSPTAIAITPDSKCAYAACNDGTLLKYRTDNQELIRSIQIGGNLMALTITSDGKFVLVISAEGILTVIESASDTVHKTVPLCIPNGMALTPDNSKLYVTCVNYSVIDMVMSNCSVMNTFAVGKGPVGIGIASDGCGYVANSNDNTISIFNTSNDKVTKTISLNNSPYAIAITPGGKYVFATSLNSNIINDIATVNQTVLNPIVVGNGPTGIAFTDDGQFAWAINSIDKTISVIDVATKSVVATVPLDTTLGTPQGIAITPAQILTKAPTSNPTTRPSEAPTIVPTYHPTIQPSYHPTDFPTSAPTSNAPIITLIISAGGSMLFACGFLTFRYLKRKNDEPGEANPLVSSDSSTMYFKKSDQESGELFFPQTLDEGFFDEL